MKYTLLVSILLFTACAKVPNSRVFPLELVKKVKIGDKPFQVLYANQAYLVGDSLLQEQLLREFDLVKLKPGGYLILVHHSGLFLEFESDGIVEWIDMAEISKQTLQLLNIEKQGSGYRPYINALLEEPEVRLERANAVGASTGYDRDFDFYADAQGALEVSSLKPIVCLKWYDLDRVPSAAGYLLRVSNIFDELLDEIPIEKPEITVDLSLYNDEKGLYILQLFDKMDRKKSSQQLGIKVGSELQHIPPECGIGSALKALEFAFFLECNAKFIAAGDYYKLAAQLSDKPIYQRIYEVYRHTK